MVHDAVARWNHVDIFKRRGTPVDEMETVFVAAVFNRTVFRKGIGVKTTTFNRQRVIHDELRRHDRIDFGGIAALLGNRIAQTCEVNQSGLTKNIVADHARWEPRKVHGLLAFDELRQAFVQIIGIFVRADVIARFTHQLLCQYTRCVGQGFIRACLDGIDGSTGIVIINIVIGKGFAVVCVHGVCSVKNSVGYGFYVLINCL